MFRTKIFYIILSILQTCVYKNQKILKLQNLQRKKKKKIKTIGYKYSPLSIAISQSHVSKGAFGQKSTHFVFIKQKLGLKKQINLMTCESLCTQFFNHILTLKAYRLHEERKRYSLQPSSFCLWTRGIPISDLILNKQKKAQPLEVDSLKDSQKKKFFFEKSLRCFTRVLFWTRVVK